MKRIKNSAAYKYFVDMITVPDDKFVQFLLRFAWIEIFFACIFIVGMCVITLLWMILRLFR